METLQIAELFGRVHHGAMRLHLSPQVFMDLPAIPQVTGATENFTEVHS